MNTKFVKEILANSLCSRRFGFGTASAFKSLEHMPANATPKSWIWKVLEESAGSILIELGIAPADMGPSALVPGLCSRCQSDREPQNSTAQYPDIFCSEKCEQAFIRSAVASLTVEDCIRMQSRLEALQLVTRRLHVT